MTGKRIADYGIRIGTLERGRLNRITDVPGVRVGHATVREEHSRTGVTVILPCPENPFVHKLTAASFVQNGFGKTVGLVQIDELGTLETPIALTNTLNTGLVADALVSYMAERCAAEHVPLRSVNPVVGETNDSRLNDILCRKVHEAEVRRAIEEACEDFAEGDVGAGAGTVCHGLKGGIGSASRVLCIAGETFTLGVLVQSNHGCLEELTIRGRRIGEEIIRARRQAPPPEMQDRGSIMMIVGCDLPVSDRQLRRVLKRCSVGLARCGSYLGHGSGDVMIGFTTANRMPAAGMDRILNHRILTESALERVFYAVAEATEEAVLNSLVAASPQTGEDGTRYDSLSEYLKGGAYDLG